ncbi:MAG: hypothetical protein QOG64_1847 [Acidimicrobiaceae bacterium]|nr:hypothetical protein [Acidimicrobiaceae bacterium]
MTTTVLAAHGLRVDLPRGWEGSIYCRESGERETAHPVLHAATFPLPVDRGDFGNGAVDRMGWDDVLIVLLEYGPASVGQALFATAGVPVPLDPSDFSPSILQKLIPGQAGTQRFFNQAGRAYCLYVVLGAYRRRERLAADASAVVASLRIEP